jgi:predicted RNase H-like HicB family nuclease
VEPGYRRERPFKTQEGSRRAAEAKQQSGPALVSRRDTIHATIQRGQSAYVAECLEVAVVTQGKTLDEVIENLQQALSLHLEDEDLASLGLADHLRVQLTYDMDLAS